MAEASELNVSVISSYDPLCTNIIDKSSSTHVYLFDDAENRWVKSKISGVFFLYQRSKAPFHSFMILNRKSLTTNQIERVTPSLQLQLHPPFILYKTNEGKIFSIWFFSREDCVRIAERLGRLVHDLGGSGVRLPHGIDLHDTETTSKCNSENSAPVLPSKPTNALSVNKLMDLIQGSGDLTQERKSPASSSEQSRKTSGELRNNKVSSKPMPQPRLEHTSPQPPNLFDMLHKAEVDFNSEHVPDAPCAGVSITSQLQRLRSACNIPSSADTTASSLASRKADASKPSAHPVPASLGKEKTPVLTPSSIGARLTSTGKQQSNHISMAELEQRLFDEENASTHLFPKGHPASDDSSPTSRSPVASGARPGAVLPQPGATRGVPPTAPLSDLDTGYADDIDEDVVAVPARNGLPGRRRHHQQSPQQQQQAVPHHRAAVSRQAELARSPAASPATQQKQQGQQPQRQVLQHPSARPEAEGIDESDGAPVAPAVLLLSGWPVAPQTGTTTTVPASATAPMSSSLVPQTASGRQTGNAGAASSTSGQLNGLTKDQLRDALVYVIQNDDEFLHQVHAAYICALQRKLMIR